MSRTRDGAPSQRQLRVGETVRHALVRILEHGGVRDPALSEARITVTEVRMSPDLRNATAYVVPFASGDPAPLVAALQRAAPFLRGQLAREVDLRVVPGLRFEADSSFERANRIERLLHALQVARDIGAAASPGGGEKEEEDGA